MNMMNMVKTKRVAKDFADAVNLQAPLSEAVLPEILRPLSACTQQVPPGKEEKRGKRRQEIRPPQKLRFDATPLAYRKHILLTILQLKPQNTSVIYLMSTCECSSVHFLLFLNRLNTSIFLYKLLRGRRRTGELGGEP